MLSRNTISSLSDKPWDHLFLLEKLSLDGNSLTEIPEGVFRNLSRLTFLDLSHNRLFHFVPQTFVGLVSLRTLSLQANQIQVSHFSWHFLSSRQSLHESLEWTQKSSRFEKWNQFSPSFDKNWGKKEKISHLDPNWSPDLSSGPANLRFLFPVFSLCRSPPLHSEGWFSLLMMIMGQMIFRRIDLIHSNETNDNFLIFKPQIEINLLQTSPFHILISVSLLTPSLFSSQILLKIYSHNWELKHSLQSNFPLYSDFWVVDCWFGNSW